MFRTPEGTVDLSTFWLLSLDTEPLTSYSSRRLYLGNSYLDFSSCCYPSFHRIVMLQSLPLRGQLSSSGLRFCHPSSLPVSMDCSPSWVRLLPLRKKISHSIPPPPNNLSFFLIQCLSGERLENHSCIHPTVM